MKTGSPLLDRRVRIHPALHVDDEGVIIGRVSERGEYQLITSRRELIAAADAKDVLAFQPRSYPDLAGRWAEEDVLAFLAGAEPPTFSETIALIMHVLDEALELPRLEHKAMMATWAVATYFHPAFLAFPRLAFSGEKESGKSKALLTFRGIAFNALYVLNPTPAVLFRLVDAYHPTLLLDEVESLSREDMRDVLAIVNAGYKAGAYVPRVEGKEVRRIEAFQVYSPMALAAIRGVNPTTEDRCLPIVLQRGIDPRRLNAEVDVTAPVFSRIRDLCYRLALTRWQEVAGAYRSLDLPSWLNSRARELWKPLFALAAVADRENGSGLTHDLRELASEHVDERDGISVEGEALLGVLAARVGGVETLTVRPGELAEDLKKRLGWRDAPTPHAIGAWLRRLGFRRSGKDREGAKYEIGSDQLAGRRAQYGLQEW